jgi:cytochrome c oxidase subunit 4
MSATTMAHAGHDHPTPKTYAKIAAILCFITLVEFVCYYITSLRPVLVPLLIVLSSIKFALVAMFYMHLKFDHNIFTRLLLIGIFLGVGVVMSLLVLFVYSHPL